MFKYVKANTDREFDTDYTIRITRGFDDFELGFNSSEDIDEVVREVAELLERNFGVVYFDESEPDFDEIWEFEQDYLEGAYEAELHNAEGTDIYYDELANMDAYEWAQSFSFVPDDFGSYKGSWGEWRKFHLG